MRKKFYVKKANQTKKECISILHPLQLKKKGEKEEKMQSRIRKKKQDGLWNLEMAETEQILKNGPQAETLISFQLL